ncbi:hypothetical protein Dsin_015416 [Dipteronia sinensis]|uniref:PB1-like domain-containing protein n=1 Tax=Dipteronia sinensis TaxID=43782 RepID=A0AAE0E505_9ROSI|nr:hypothetical protein Dsin_015416 [Dipteronia sinensis]
MVRERENPDEVPEYGSDDLDIFFSFKVHHGGHFDVTMDSYNGGRINYFDYINIDELSMLDLDEIAMKLKYKLPVGYWIQLPSDDEDNRASVEASDIEVNRASAAASDIEVNRASAAASEIEVNKASAAAADTEDGPTGFGDGLAGFGDGPTALGDGSAGFGDGPAAEEEEEAEDAEADKGDEIVESDYDQDAEDIAAETCVDPTKDWDCLQVSDLPRGSGSFNDDGSEDLGSLDGSNGEEDDARPVRKFIRRRYHEFNPRHDMQDPVFRLGMEFSSAAVFRNAIRAHSLKHRKDLKLGMQTVDGLNLCNQDRLQLRLNMLRLISWFCLVSFCYVVNIDHLLKFVMLDMLLCFCTIVNTFNVIKLFALTIVMLWTQGRKTKEVQMMKMKFSKMNNNLSKMKKNKKFWYMKMKFRTRRKRKNKFSKKNILSDIQMSSDKIALCTFARAARM